MSKLALIGLALFLVSAPDASFACSSDFSCGYGSRCVKAPLQSSGTCMRNVDEHGIRQFTPPRTNSIGPNMNVRGQCDFNTDCPIGFRCDQRLKACVK